MSSLLILLSVLSVALALPISNSADLVYEDNFARTKMTILAAAVFAENPQTCLSTHFGKAELKRKISVKCDVTKLDECVGYSAVLKDDKAIVIAFRGTVGTIELIVESYETVFDNHTAWVSGGSVSEYFNNAFFNIWNHGMKDDVASLINKNPKFEVWVTGHSLGGALASLAATYISHLGLVDRTKIKLITLGQPRTGDRAYADAHDLEVPYSYRVIHAHDIVPHLPPNGLEKYRHHKNEIWYNNDMTQVSYEECDEQESLKCSDRYLDNSVNDHHRYFNIYISDYGTNGCQ